MKSEKMKLPNQRNIVLGDILVSGDESHLLINGGCDKQTVKRVSMNHRQRFKGGKMSRLNWKNSNVICLYSFNKTSNITRKTQLAYIDFNSQFPSGNNTHIYTINAVADNLVGVFGQQGIACKKPYSDMGVNQIAVHLHIVLEVIKRCIKVICHPVITFYTAEFTFFLLFCNRRLISISYISLSRRNFGRHVNRQPMANRNFYSLRNTHKENIA